jgi:iron(III) transport system substrate-binding protein
MAAAFEENTDIKVTVYNKPAGIALDHIKAEEKSPKGDVWWGGSGDLHSIAAQEDLTAEHLSEFRDQLQSWGLAQAERTQNKSVGIHTGAIGFAYNKDLLTVHDLPVPECWEDLLRPEYKSHISMADPNSSGMAFTTMVTMAQYLGEDIGLAYMKGLHSNVKEYGSTDEASVQALASEEATIGIGYLHDAKKLAIEGYPIVFVEPCEGTAHDVSAMSIIANAPNPKNAIAFYDWALSAEAQSLAVQVNAFQMPANIAAEKTEHTLATGDFSLIEYDFEAAGIPANRNRLLRLWNDEVAILPR